MKNDDGLLNDTIRARLTGEEYNGLTKDEVEKYYIQEYGELPPNFDIITANELGLGKESGFDGTAIHFHNEEVNEVYLFNRGTEFDVDQFKALTDDLLGNIQDYRNDPQELRGIAFKGNEDIYSNVFGVLMGDDQSQTLANEKFTEEIKNKTLKIKNNQSPNYYLDGHSLGGSEGQNVLTIYDDLFTNVNVYNDAPMNIYNIILVNDNLKKMVQKEFQLEINDINNLKEINTQQLQSFVDQEIGHLSDKITYYRNEDDLLTNLTLPYEYRLANDKNIVMFESDNPNVEMIDLPTKYPDVMILLEGLLGEATTEGITITNALATVLLYVNSKMIPEFLQFEIEKQVAEM